MKPYRLLLISEGKPDSPEEIDGSMRMIAWALWQEFGKMPHVNLFYHDINNLLDPSLKVDFILIHLSDIRTPIFKQLDRLHRLGAAKVMWIMESPPVGNRADYHFLWRPLEPNVRGEHIHLPYLSGLLSDSMKGIKKVAGSVLLDHVYDITPRSAENRKWWNDIASWLYPLWEEGRTIGQLRRFQHEEGWFELPKWMVSVPQSNFVEYLRLTASFENFIMTHPGSYEHSVLDMVARGIRVIVPVEGELEFVPQVAELQLPTFTNEKELRAILNTPLEDNWRVGLCTDMPVVAARINQYCQEQFS